MKITIKFEEIELVYEEPQETTKYPRIALKDDNLLIISTIKAMCEEVKNLKTNL